MLMWQLLLLLLASAMLALTPAALASPPDQHWLTGVYDDADYDDVVLAVLESVALVELPSPHDSQIDEATVAVVFRTDERVYVAPLRSSNLPRAPPAP
jgi:hypothetical protein